MKVNYDDIHQSLIFKSSKLKELKNQIFMNGVIRIPKPKIDFFAFMVKTIISQQISDKAANSIWKKFCKYFDKNTPKFKNIKNICSLELQLKNIGISNRKIEYILTIYQSMLSKSLNSNLLKNQSENEIKKKLTKLKGIGMWTCDMILIFFLIRPNILPESDLIIKKVKKKICCMEDKEINFNKIFSPNLSILSLHMWKMSKRIL